jgi:diguanylate cyclase (GGDEF)-like protein
MPRPRSVYDAADLDLVRHSQLTLESLEAPAAAGQIAAKKARYRALHDELTMLPNGEYFRARLDLALCRAAPPQQTLAVLHLSINLEDFKPSIDAYGAAAGDEMLRRIAARLAIAPRAEDMLCRLQEDQFACLVPGLPKRDQLSELADRLLDAVPFPLRIGILQLCVRPSIGIAIYPAHGASAQSLLANAETAMRRAKRRDASYAFVDEG